MTDIKQRAGELMDAGYGCAEAVLMACAEDQGIESPLIPGIASGFCGGIGSSKRMICGAVSGAIMALNLVYGRQTPDQSKDENYDAVNEFVRRFKEMFSTTNCETLLEQGAFCRRYTIEAAAMVKDIIAE